MTREEYIKSLKDAGVSEEQFIALLAEFDEKLAQVGKITGATTVGANAAPDNQAPKSEFSLEDGSLGSAPSRAAILSGLTPEQLKQPKQESIPDLTLPKFKTEKQRFEEAEEVEKKGLDKFIDINPSKLLTVPEKVFGSNEFTDFFGDLSRSWDSGKAQGYSLDTALELYKDDTTPEELMAFLKTARQMENQAQTDEMIAFGEAYAKKKEDMGGFKAFFSSWWENPTAMTQFSAQSMGNMYASLTSSEEAFAAASAGAAVVGGGGAAVGSVVPVVGTAVGGVTGAISGAMGGLSTTMEIGFTTAELLQEVAEEELKKRGSKLQWANMTDEQRFAISSEIINNPELKSEITNRALKRGLTIGFIDTVTGMVTGGAAGATRKVVASTGRAALARGAQVVAAGTTETVGGLASEIGGQYAAGQEFDAREILTEGFADKSFTIIEAGKATSGVKIKPGKALLDATANVVAPAKYSINGEVLSASKFREVIKGMDDSTIMGTTIKIDNDQVMSKIIDNRMQRINLDQKIDPKISDVNDRADIIDAEVKLNALKNNDTKSAVNKKTELSNKIKEIQSKYADATVDVTIQERQQAIANSSQARIENEFNKNAFNVIQAAEDVQGVNVRRFNTTAEVENFLNETEDINVSDVKRSAGQQGFVIQRADGTQDIILNKEQAVKDKAVNVAGHEFLHAVLFKTVKDNPQNAINLGNSLLSELNKIDVNQIQDSQFKERMALYNDQSRDVQMEEALTLFSDAIATGDIKFQENSFTRIGDVIRRTLQRFGVNIKFNNGRDVYNFIRDYNKSIGEGGLNLAQRTLAAEGATGSLIGTQPVEQETTIKESKGALDAINAIVPNTIKTKQEFQNNTEVFTKAFDATQPNGVISNYVRSRSSSKAQADATIQSIQDRLMNFDPAMNKTFGEFVFANTNFARLDANKQLAQEQARRARETRIDQSTRQIADTQTETTPQDVTDRRKINILRFDRVNESDLVSSVKVNPNDTFKQVIDNNVNNVANKVFNVPADKITSPTKNLTYAKKIVNGIPEASEAGNIQDWFRQGQNAEKFIRILPDENVSADTADINELGENIDVARDVKGFSIGMKGRVLNYFYNKTNRRSKGLTSQPAIWELKPEFRNPSPQVVEQFKNDLGITPTGQLNNYNRNIGQLLKGVAKTYSQQASLSSAQRVLEQQTQTPAVKKQTASVTAAQKSRVVYSKKDASKTRFNEKVSGTVNKSRIQDAKDNNYKPGPKYTNAPKKLYDRNKKLPKSVRAFEGENVIQGISRITNNFLSRYPRYEQFLNKALTFGVDRSPFGVQELWNKNIMKRGSEDQASFKKPNYTDGKTIRKSWYESTKKSDYVNNELKKLDDLIQFYKDFETYAKDNKKDLWFLDELAVAAQSAQSSPLRGNAPTFLFERKPGTKEPLLGVKGVEEHTQPQNEAISILTGGVNNNTLDQAAKTVKATYMQGFLSLKNNDLLDVDFKSTMPDLLYKAIDNNLKLEPGLLSTIRLSEAGVDLSNIEYIPTGQTLAEYFFNDNNIDVKTQKQLMIDLFEGKSTLKQLRDYGKANSKVTVNKQKVFNKNSNEATPKYSKANNNEGLQNDLNNYDKALRNAKNTKAPRKGISIFDFDDTLATTGSKILVTMPDGTETKITPAEFAKKHSELQQQGAEFNFDEFNKVVDGKPALASKKLQKAIDKFGNKDVYVLTARPQQSAGAIYEFLKGIGLEVPLENITGLEDGTPQAKANWVIGKAAEGYNDFYFTDDVYKNVKAVQDALEVLDVKSKSRVAYENMQKKLDRDFNDILEAKTGIAAEKEYSRAKATVVGANKGRFKFFIPPSAEDFVGLLYNTLSKGKLGDSQMAWYKKNLLDPFASAMHAVSRERISLMNDYKQLKKQLGIVPKNLRKKIAGETFTNEQAVRVYIWNKQGMTIPDLSKADLKELTNYINSKQDLKTFADQLIAINKEDGYVRPNIGWLGGTITTDLLQNLGTTKRAKHLQQWQNNVDIIFSEKNLNKMEAAFGKAHRVALEGILERMKTGRNRNFQSDSITGRVTDWLTNSIGTIMFFNTRSALLQTISSVNFINFSDNNIFKAGKAFANQKQFWKDFMFLMNSEFLVDRRRGLRINVNEADIANMARQGGARGVVSKMLELGFLPTQIADSFAIASGGASFYRNRVNKYKKQGIEQKAAEERAFKDFREIAEESQQSSRPDRISAQQAGPLGRIILAFGNTPMQYARLIKKASSDLINRRGDMKTNISKIIYYAAVQNLIFNALQQAIFAIAFGDIDEEEEEDKYINIANGMADSLLRGLGVAGAFVSVGKNVIKRVIDESEKPNPKYEKVGYELTRISPPISSKLSRINQAARAFQWEKEEMREKGFAIDNPALLAGANVVSATTNVPLDRLVKKTNNVVQATTQDLDMWERLALLGGWQDWEIGADKEDKKPVLYGPRIQNRKTIESKDRIINRRTIPDSGN